MSATVFRRAIYKAHSDVDHSQLTLIIANHADLKM